MSDREECRNCHSREVMPNVRIVATEPGHFPGPLSAEVQRKPAAWLFKGKKSARIHGRVCGRCGFVELFVEDPEALYAAHQEAGS